MDFVKPHAQDVIDDAPEKGAIELNTKAPQGKTAADMLGDGLLYEPIKTDYQGKDMSQPKEYTQNLEGEAFGFWESLAENARTGIIGTGARKVQAFMLGDEELFNSNRQQYQPNDEDIEYLYEQGIPPSAMNAVLAGATSKESFMSNVGIVKDNLEVERKTQNSGIGGYVGGMVGEMISDPTTFIPLGGAAGAGAKGAAKLFNSGLARQLVANVSTSAASEAFLRNQITGREADVGGAIVGSVAATVGIYGVGRMVNRSMLNRIEATETARLSNSENPNVVPNTEGVPKFIDDGEGGQLEIMESGRVFTKGVIPPKASAPFATPSVGFADLRDLATVSASADNESIRGFASMLTRPVQGYKGDFAAEVPNVDQINRMLNSRGNILLSDIGEALDEITDRHIITGGKLTERDDVMKRIYQHAAGNPNAQELTQAELKVAQRVRDFFDNFEDMLDDPSMLSGRKSPKLMTKSGQGNYMPRTYKSEAIESLSRKYGIEDVQKAIKGSYMDAYNTASNKTSFDEAILKDYPEGTQMTPEILDDYLSKKAYGIANGDAPNSRDIFDSSEGGSLRNPDYLKSRIPMGTHGKATLPDGTPFSVDDILEYNIESGLGSYMRAMNGKVALAAGTGMDELGINKTLKELRANAKTAADTSAVDAIENTIKGFSNITRSGDYGLMDVLSDTLRDTAFMQSNALMYAGQMAEVLSNTLSKPIVVAMATKNMAGIFGKTLKQILKMAPEEMERTMGDTVAGMNIAKRMNLSIADWKKGQAARMGRTVEQLDTFTDKALTARYAALKGAEKSPFTWLLNKTTEAVVKAGNDAGMEELISHANGKFTSSLLSEKFLKSNGLPSSIVDDVTSLLKGMTSKDTDKIDFKDRRWSSVTQVLHAFNDELIMKRDLTGQGYASNKLQGPIGRALLQFKGFALASSAYATKNFKDVVQLQRMDRALFAIGSIAISGTVGYTAITGMKSLGMSEDKRQEYLDENLSLEMLSVGALKRSPLLASASLMYDTVGGFLDAPYAGLGKTTYEDVASFNLEAEVSTGAGLQNKVVDHLAGMFPAARVPFNAIAGTKNAGSLILDSLDDSTVRTSQEAAMQRATARAFGSFLPNDPLVVKPLYRIMMEELGVDLEAK